ncbi:MAG TPA: hypothetical protein VLF79_01620 [Candidatus Saccharimonadales bacterium]|nr:hypothetical protein [Candidatus Saccharimonadales bacterium]
MEALSALPQSEHPVDQELRIRTDTKTWLAEVLNGNMYTSFEFTFDGEDLYGEDDGSLTEVFEDSVEDAKILAEDNPNFQFELRRRLIEREELEEIKAMAAGELGDTNTIIVVSDFPPELMDSKTDIGGYNTNRKQTMLRVITRDEAGKIHIDTQSLDQSNRPALEAIYNAFGKKPETGELLSQRIHRNIHPNWQNQTSNNLRSVYDGKLSQEFGGEWYGGRRPADDRNTYEFVETRLGDIIDWYTNQKMLNSTASDRMRFKLAATAEERFETFKNGIGTTRFNMTGNFHEASVSLHGLTNSPSLQVEMSRAERRAARSGKTYSGCGASVSAEQEEELSTIDQLSNSGYGNKASGGKDRFGSLKFKCPNGHENTRPRNKLIDKCGKCGVSVKC